MKKLTAISFAFLFATSPMALAQRAGEPGEQGGVQSGADGTMPGTTGAPGANAPGGTGTAGTGPTTTGPVGGPGPDTRRGAEDTPPANTLAEGQRQSDGMPGGGTATR